MTKKSDGNEMFWKRTPHRLKASCPVTCMRRQMPGRAYQAIRKHLRGQGIPDPVVRDVVNLYWYDEITSVQGLSSDGRDAIIASLKTVGLLPAGLLHPEMTAQARTKILTFMREEGYIPSRPRRAEPPSRPGLLQRMRR